jgi:hypothetical protein
MEKKLNNEKSRLLMFIMNKWVSKPIYAVCKLGIADILSQGPMAIKKIAELSGTDEKSLYRILRALACMGIFSEVDKKVFKHTRMSEFLKTGKIGFFYSLMFNDTWNDKAWLEIIKSIKTGKSGFEISHGKPLFKWLENNPGTFKVFEESNSIRSRQIAKSLTDSYDFSRVRNIVDVGGGKGDLLIEILGKHKDIKGLIAENSPAERINANIDKSGLSNRCRLVKCDFFKKVPTGGDLYILSNILHDWKDAECIKILSNIRKSMKNNSRILILEMVIPEGDAFSVSKLLDLEMMMVTGGLERTKEEFIGLYRASKLDLVNEIKIKDDTNIMELEKRF